MGASTPEEELRNKKSTYQHGSSADDKTDVFLLTIDNICRGNARQVQEQA